MGAAHSNMANPPKQTALPVPGNSAPVPTNAVAVALAGPQPAPAAGTLPAANVTHAPAKGRTATLAGVVGGTYGVAVAPPNGPGAPSGGTTGPVVLPYKVPAWAGAPGAPCTITVASTAPNWLGCNGLPLLCTVYHSPAGVVVVQRHAGGCKVNAYPAGMAGTGIAVVGM
jgi:hypothetical protein